MKNKDTYKNKIQNMFTAYVVRSVKGAKRSQDEIHGQEKLQGKYGESSGRRCGV